MRNKYARFNLEARFFLFNKIVKAGDAHAAFYCGGPGLLLPKFKNVKCEFFSVEFFIGFYTLVTISFR